MRRTWQVVLSCLIASGCARSIHDRELDAVFAHQARLRDTTGTVAGVVVDSLTRAPLGGVLLEAQHMGDISDSAGRFTIEYLPEESVTVRATRPGFRPAEITAGVHAHDTSHVELSMVRSPSPCCSLAGRWRIDLWLDSADLRQKPTARTTTGSLVFSEAIRHPLGDDPSAHDPLVSTIAGYFNIDFGGFWGRQLAADFAVTIMGPSDSSLAIEAVATVFDLDSVEVDLIPRVDHGGISFGGRLHGDTLEGAWYQRAYCCGAEGHYRMVRISLDPGAIPVFKPPREERPDTLAEADRAEVRVRIWDSATNGYIKGKHDLKLPDGSIKSVYTTGTQAEGWGVWFWLPPGRYAILMNRYPCGSEEFWLKNEIRRPFVAEAGTHTEITIQIDSRAVKADRSYNNPDGARCST